MTLQAAEVDTILTSGFAGSDTINWLGVDADAESFGVEYIVACNGSPSCLTIKYTTPNSVVEVVLRVSKDAPVNSLEN